ncbi:MAG: hypothetical protein JWN48_2512 [Myxococcaceae bacterium]|nr:hypothetical protein [Myxococcaceae bacterium]
MQTNPDAVAILAHHPGHYLVAAFRNVSMVYWMRQGTLEAVSRIREALEEAHDRAPERAFSTIHLIRDGAGLPEPDVRTAVLSMSSHLAPRTACLAIVLMGAGFWASALQSVLTALRMLAPQRSALMRFARDPAELGAWFPAEHTRRTTVFLGAGELASALETVFVLAQRAQARAEPRPGEPTRKGT